MTTWNTLYDKIIVRRDSADQVVKGINVAPAHEKAKNTGIVVEIGAGRMVSGSFATLHPLIIQREMEVLFHEHSGVPLESDDSLIILREDEVLAYRWPASKLEAVG